MKLSTITAAALVSACCATSQAAFTITSGNATFSSAQTPFFQDSTLNTVDFKPDSTTDHMFYYNWSYRAPGQGNRGFSWLDTPTQVVAGDTVTFTYTNAGPNPVGFNRFNAVLRLKITDGAVPGAARLEAFLVFTAAATNSGPTSWEILNGCDFDVGGTSANDVCTVTNATGVVGNATDSVTGDVLSFWGSQANRFEVNNGSTLRTKLTGGSLNNLTNAVSFSGDGGAGFQWSIVNLAPGASVELRSTFALNTTILPCPPDLNGDASIGTPDLLVLLGNFGATVPAFTSGDLNGDGVVNTADLLIMLGAFGTTC